MAISSISNSIGRVMNSTAKKLAGPLEKGFVDQARFAGKMIVISIVSKDAINCVFYTYQSLHNKKIPEEKRKFVAAIDLMNGIIMVGGQLLAGMIIEKKFGPWFIGKHFTGVSEYKNLKKPITTNATLASDNLFDLARKAVSEKSAELKAMGVDVAKISSDDITYIGKKAITNFGSKSAKYKAIAGGIGIIVTSLGTMALVKRTIAPLLSTPLAGWFKEKYMDNKDKKPDPVEDRMYYQWVSLSPKYNNQLDKTAFSNVTGSIK